MSNRSKRYKNLHESIKKKDLKNLEQIIKELKNGSGVKFMESIDLSLKINLKKIKGPENSLRRKREKNFISCFISWCFRVSLNC